MKFRILSEADEETLQAALWYDAQQSGLGEGFLAERELALESIRRSPFSHARLEYYRGPHEIRRKMLRRFPYAVIFFCRPDETLVVAVAHLRRRPLYWLDRVG